MFNGTAYTRSNFSIKSDIHSSLLLSPYLQIKRALPNSSYTAYTKYVEKCKIKNGLITFNYVRREFCELTNDRAHFFVSCFCSTMENDKKKKCTKKNCCYLYCLRVQIEKKNV